MFGICSFCYAVRPGRLAPVPHKIDCPTGSRPPKRLDADQSLFFRHPDLAAIDLEIAAWYPAAA